MLILLLVSQLYTGAFAATCPHGSNRFNCITFLDNHDGDTLTVTIPDVHPFFGNKIKVRVLGIDTPESHGKTPCETEWSRVAKNLVASELSHAKRIDLIVDFKKRLDKYGRVLAKVSYDGKDLAEVMLKNKLAVPYFGKKKQVTDWCKMQNARRGHP